MTNVECRMSNEGILSIFKNPKSEIDHLYPHNPKSEIDYLYPHNPKSAFQNPQSAFSEFRIHLFVFCPLSSVFTLFALLFSEFRIPTSHFNNLSSDICPLSSVFCLYPLRPALCALPFSDFPPGRRRRPLRAGGRIDSRGIVQQPAERRRVPLPTSHFQNLSSALRHLSSDICPLSSVLCHQFTQFALTSRGPDRKL
jgi:hypothetical protein